MQGRFFDAWGCGLFAQGGIDADLIKFINAADGLNRCVAEDAGPG
jgi:hypothetical protein